jgi:hypothetical protein
MLARIVNARSCGLSAFAVTRKIVTGLVSVALFFGLTTSALAQNYESAIRGTVSGADSSVVVEVVDSTRGTSKSSSVDADGSFRFSSLPPGTYEVNVVKGGQVVDSQSVDVAMGATATLYMGVDAATIEQIVVTGKRIAAVDTSIAESGLVIGTDELLELPVGRDLTSVSLLAPGVHRGDTAFGYNASFAGASVAENTNFVNGLNTTNFRNGLGFSQVPFEFYETIQIKTGGYSDKYGRSTGGVMNARTKSGSNEFKAGANVYYEFRQETSPNTYANLNDEDVFEDTNIDVYASGPIIKDRLFYYALYSDANVDNEYYGVTSGRGYKSNVSEGFWGVKIDGYITDNHRIEYTAFSDERTDFEGAYSYDSDTRVLGQYFGDTEYRDGGDNWIATYTGNFTDNLTVAVSYGENEANRTTAPATANLPFVRRYDGGLFTIISNTAGAFIDVGTDKRELSRIDVSYSIGDHIIDFGFDQEKNNAENNTLFSGGAYWLLDEGGVYTGCTAAECPAGSAARKRTYISGGSFDVESTAIYIQDTWEFNENLTLELGLRNESFDNLNAEGASFVKIDDQIAPRVSAVWDPDGTGKRKWFANWGLYYLPVAANTNIRMAGGETYIQDYYAWDGTCLNADLSPCNLGAVFDQDLFADGDVPDTRSLTDANIEPMYQSEFILGYQWVTDSGIEMGVKGIYRNLETSLEDVAIDAAVIDYYNASGTWDASMVGGDTVEETFTGFHQYVLTNPGADMYVYIPEQDEFISLSAAELNYPKAERQYGALEFTYKRPFDGVWALNASYTWAHSWGNNEGYVRSDNGQDDAGITTNFDQPGLTDFAYGNLPNDRRHTIKVFGTYQMDNGLRLGTNVMWNSGRPLNCFGLHPRDEFAQQYGGESFFCGGKGAKRGSLGTTPDILRVDLNVSYATQLGDFDVLFGLDVFNLFDSQNAVELNELKEEGNSYPGAVQPNYGFISSYQQPRTIRLSARFAFE